MDTPPTILKANFNHNVITKTEIVNQIDNAYMVKEQELTCLWNEIQF